MTRTLKRTGAVDILSPWILKTLAGTGSSRPKSMMPTTVPESVPTPFCRGIPTTTSCSRPILRGLGAHAVQPGRCHQSPCSTSTLTPTLFSPYFRGWWWTSAGAHNCTQSTIFIFRVQFIFKPISQL